MSGTSGDGVDVALTEIGCAPGCDMRVLPPSAAEHLRLSRLLLPRLRQIWDTNVETMHTSSTTST